MNTTTQYIPSRELDKVWKFDKEEQVFNDMY